LILSLFIFHMVQYTTSMFTNLDFIHTRICYGFLNESNHQEYSVLFVAISIRSHKKFMHFLLIF
jgi:hypothetical protein